MARKVGSDTIRIYLFALAFFGWFALISQFYLMMHTTKASVAEILARYFTFFTLLTNILLAICSTVLFWKPASAWGKFFSKATTITALAVYITIVSVIYNAILRFLWSPKGLQWVVDELLHVVIPLAFIIFWLLFSPRGQIKWANILLWMVYPLVYLFVILTRGAFSGYYPYPFLDVSKIGYHHTLLNCARVAAAFIIVGILYVGIDRRLDQKPA